MENLIMAAIFGAIFGAFAWGFHKVREWLAPKNNGDQDNHHEARPPRD